MKANTYITSNAKKDMMLYIISSIDCYTAPRDLVNFKKGGTFSHRQNIIIRPAYYIPYYKIFYLLIIFKLNIDLYFSSVR